MKTQGNLSNHSSSFLYNVIIFLIVLISGGGGTKFSAANVYALSPSSIGVAPPTQTSVLAITSVAKRRSSTTYDLKTKIRKSQSSLHLSAASSSEGFRQRLSNMNKDVSNQAKTSTLSKIMRSPIVPIILTSLIALFKVLSNHTIRQFISSFFVKFPYIAAFIICAFKASLADLVVQKLVSLKSNLPIKFEYKRNIAFFFYGGFYQGCVQEHIFNHIYPYLFGNGVDIKTVGMKVLVDIFCVSPFLCLPLAYMIKGSIYKASLLNSIKRYIHDVQVNGLLRKHWIGELNCL